MEEADVTLAATILALVALLVMLGLRTIKMEDEDATDSWRKE